MVTEAVAELRDKTPGSSLPGVRRWVRANYAVGNLADASFNKKTIDGLRTAVASGVLDRDQGKHHYRISLREKNRRKQEEAMRLRSKALGGIPSGAGAKGILARPVRGGDESAGGFEGTALAHNNHARVRFETLLGRRDAYLRERMHLLRAVLPAKNYFSRQDEKLAKAAGDGGGLAIDRTKPLVGAAHGLSTTSALAISSSSSSAAPIPNPTSTLNPASALASAQAANPNPTPTPTPTLADPLEALEAELAEVSPEQALAEALHSSMRGVPLLIQRPSLEATLHDHQVQGISWMVHMFRQGMPMILGDQMGLGKTLQSIGFLTHLKVAASRRTHTLALEYP